MVIKSREELIAICGDSVVPAEKWSDRDSYSAQVNVEKVYQLLKAGCEFIATVDVYGDFIDVSFNNITHEQERASMCVCLDIDSLEDYKGEGEMFYAERCIDFDKKYIGGYIPTRKRLEEFDGRDWY